MTSYQVKTTGELNEELYRKLSKELEEYRKELLSQTPDEILKQAYDYVIRQDIVLSLEYHDVNARQAQVLLRTDNALDAIFTKWENLETDHMDHIQNAVECAANEIFRREDIAEQRKRKAYSRGDR